MRIHTYTYMQISVQFALTAKDKFGKTISAYLMILQQKRHLMDNWHKILHRS